MCGYCHMRDCPQPTESGEPWSCKFLPNQELFAQLDPGYPRYGRIWQPAADQDIPVFIDNAGNPLPGGRSGITCSRDAELFVIGSNVGSAVLSAQITRGIVVRASAEGRPDTAVARALLHLAIQQLGGDT